MSVDNRELAASRPRRLLRWTAIAIGSLIGLGLIAYAAVYGLSERILQRSYEVPAVALTIPTDPDSIREGRRLAAVRGCFGCHGNNGQGQVMFDDPKIARIVAPNLTDAVRRYSDAQLAIIIRNGVRPDGRSMLVMPAEAFNAMTDADLGRTIAFLRSLPPVPGPGPSISAGPIGRLGLVTGKFKTAAQLIAETVPPPKAVSPETELGRYLARTICAECHGTSLRGDSNPDFTSPDLRVVAAYSPEAFARLLRTGVALGDRSLGVMSEQARDYLSQLSDAEIAALYGYLHALPEAAHKQSR
jgi:mono/diheme cytochrome c family protein